MSQDQNEADSQPPSLDKLVAVVADAPKGQVTLGEKAGAFGPWRAHQVINEIAKNIAGRATEQLRACGEPEPRVLVVDDRRLLPDEWTARYVPSVLRRVRDRLADAKARLQEAARSPADPQESLAGRRRGTVPGDLTLPKFAEDGPAGGLDAAINLLGLLQTDYTITAAAVSPAPSELSTLTAAHLTTADAPVTVEADAFATAGSSPTAALFGEVLELRDATVRELAGAQATALVGYAQQVVTDADTAVAALLNASETSDAPLVTAIRYERLDQAVTSRRITHVLYVNLDAVAADVVTRRSILGTSGRVRFLSSGNASWLLLATADNAIKGGGQESLADVMTLSLETGQTHFDTALGPTSAAAGTDPLDGLEKWAKGFVAVLALVLFALGVLSVIAIVRLALGK